MEFTTYVRKPFSVEAIEITRDNIEEVAQYIGTLEKKPNGTPYIVVDEELVPNVEKVFPGFFMTRMRSNVRCYSRKVFTSQFMEMGAWVNSMMDNEGSY